MQDKITVLTHCSNDIDYIDIYVDRWKDADDIYVLVDNCKDGTYQKLLDYSKIYPQFHIFYHAYTTFRFDLIRNDLLRYVKDREGYFLFVPTDCWFIEDTWKEPLLSLYKNPNKIFEKYTSKQEEDLPQEQWLIGIHKENLLETHLGFYKHPFFQEIVWMYRGCIDKLFTVNPGGGEGFRAIQSIVETIRIPEDSNEIFPLHLFHARARKKGEPRWPSKSLILENIKHLIFLLEEGKLGKDTYSSWRFLAKTWAETSFTLDNFDDFYQFLCLILSKTQTDDLKEEMKEDSKLLERFSEVLDESN